MDLAELSRNFQDYHRETVEGRKATDQKLDAIQARTDEIERKANRAGLFSSSGRSVEDYGDRFVRSDALRSFMASGFKGRYGLDVKAITLGSITSAGATTTALNLTPIDGQPLVPTIQRRLTIRDLLAPGVTAAYGVAFPRVTGFTNNAAPVAEQALKPESALTFDQMIAPVRTIAHWIPVTRQALDDAPGLAGIIRTDLLYGLKYTEEVQLLLGDGQGENLYGLVVNSTAYDTSRNVAGDTRADTIAHAIAQSEVAQLDATGIIMNTNDYHKILVLKDVGGNYLGNGPFGGGQQRTLWTLPVATTMAMPVGKFMVGAFGTAAQIFDRLDAEIAISDQDRDNFIRNMYTIRAEERLTLAVKRPEALIYGSFPQAA